MEPIKSDPSFRGYTKINGVTQKLKDGIASGAEKTRNQWAEELQVPVSKISASLTWLHKHGYLYYPTGVNQPVRDIMKDQEQIRSVVNRQDITFLAPHIEAISRIVEQAASKFPHLVPIFQKFLLDKATTLTITHKNLNGNHKLISPKN